MRPPKPVVRAVDRHVVSPSLGMRFALGRRILEALHRLDPVPSGVACHDADFGARRGKLIVPDGADSSPRILWLHGGGYCYGSATVHSTFLAHLARATRATVFAPDYRLAPEHPYPAALEDALAVHGAFAASAEPPIMAGDSAGAGLALAAAIRVRDSGETPLPARLLLISPWVDLTCAGESIRVNAARDALLKPQYLDRCAAAYAGALPRSDARVSPLFADLAGLPPTLIHAGADELLRSESVELARRMAGSGVAVEHRVFERAWHDFHLHAGMLREADEAVREIAAWIARAGAQGAGSSA